MSTSVEAEIEKHRFLLNAARTLNHKMANATLADLERELEQSLAIVKDLVGRFGGESRLNSRSLRPDTGQSSSSQLAANLAAQLWGNISEQQRGRWCPDCAGD